MKFINKYNNIEDYNGDVNRPIHNTVSYIKNEGRIIYTPIPSHIEFADPEVIRVLRDQVGLAFEGNKAKLSDIEGVNSFGNSFYENEVITQFPELRYFTGLTILSETFSECSNLTTVGDIIPEGVTSLSYTFSGCSSLTTAPVIPEGVTDLESAFSGCSSLTTAPVIPEGVTDLAYAFSGCSSLTTAPVIPEGVTDLESTFSSCSSLTKAPNIPSRVTNLESTFYNCSSLTTAPTIPSSVTNLSGAFNGCSRLGGIFTIEAINPPTIDGGTFYSVAMVAIYVPDESVQLYKEATGWIAHASIIKPISEK